MIFSQRKDSLLGSLFVSIFIHTLLILSFLFLAKITTTTTKEETYYVDILDMPSKNPRFGTPSTTSEVTGKSLQKETNKDSVQTESTKPSKLNQKSDVTKDSTSATESDFKKKLSKLKQKSDAQQAQDAIKRLKQDSGSRSGRGSGSSYNSYIKSRLEDALRETIAYNSTSPKVDVLLVINPNGKIIKKQVLSSTGDGAFVASVMRAISLAEEKFPPNPSKTNFSEVYGFTRKGVRKQ